MALSIGELVGYLSFDDSGVDQGARSAEQRIAKMGATATSELEGTSTRIGAAGRAAGASYGTELGDGVARGAATGADRAGAEVQSGAGRWKTGLATAGAAAGAAGGLALSTGLATAMELDSMNARLSAGLNLSTEEAARIGGVAGQLYADAYGESLGDVEVAISAVVSQIDGMSSATDAELKAVSGQAMSLATTLGVDVTEAAEALGQMIRTGLAGNAAEALDLLAAGAGANANRFGDLTSTLAGSAGTLAQFGLSGEQAIGLITQSLDAGAPSADFFIGALEELAGNAGDSIEVFDSLGLSGAQMAADLNAGGPRAASALDALLDALRGMQDPAARSTALVGLFGEEATAMQAALLAVDPSATVGMFNDIGDAAEENDRKLQDMATKTVAQLQRGFEVWTGSLIATEGPLGAVAAGAAAFGPQALAMAGSLSMVGMAMGPLIVKLLSLGTTVVVTSAKFVASLLRMSLNAALAVGRVLVSLTLWVAQTVAQGAIAVASMVATAARYVAAWVLMGVQAMARAAMMAAAWLVAMGPIGWVIAAVVGLVALIIANWDTVVAWTQQAWSAVTAAIGAAWEWIKSAVSTAIDFLVGLFLNFTGPGLIIKHWDSIVAATSAAWDAVVAFIRSAVDQALAVLGWLGRLPGLIGGWFSSAYQAVKDWLGRALGVVAALPGQILGALGNLGSLLYNAGRDLVTGLWNGIVGMGRWLYSKIMGWIRSVVPGPVLSFLGIASPSKFMKNEVGKWIPEGLADGILGNAKVAGDAARDMAMGVADAARVDELAVGAVAFNATGGSSLGGVGGMTEGLARGLTEAEVERAFDRVMTRHRSLAERPNISISSYNPVAQRTSAEIGSAASTLAALGPWGPW